MMVLCVARDGTRESSHRTRVDHAWYLGVGSFSFGEGGGRSDGCSQVLTVTVQGATPCTLR
eukprot:NODE_11755_length_218_cov_4.130178_g11014_i0.p1 GENE.NODE_11755_length_218_cov_4.130178_g11014_i0~~NODE_11755_length_218_cov_4.130178_g11014_i0.p1  ORF type:complete len:71 (+),score=17.19 NODE_11755_length_218_cov_4.130178_g11014_i0:32-214(+)